MEVSLVTDHQEELRRSKKYENHLTDEEKALLEKNKRKKKRIIISIICLIFIILLGVIIYLIVENKNAQSQINAFDKAVKERKYSKLVEMMKSNEHNVTNEDMRRFCDYILLNDENKKRFNNDITQLKKTVDKDDAYDNSIGQIKDKNGRSIIDVSRDGVKLLVFQKVSFEPNYYKVYIQDSGNDVEYEFQNNGKSKSVIVPKGQKTELGDFFVGQYNINATKKYDENSDVEGTSEGQIKIDTDKSNKKHEVIATDDFNETWFKVKFKNQKELDNHYTLSIDDKEVDYDKDKVYGKYPSNSYLVVNAKGRMNDSTIHTNDVEVEANKTDKPQIITLTFNQKEIDKELKKNEEVKKEAKDFIKKYTKSLNTAYKVSDFNGMKRYYENDNSDVAKSIEKQVKSKKKTQFSDVKMTSFSRKSDVIKITISKKDNHNRSIQSEYTLKYNEKEDEFKIIDYTDV